MTTPSAAGRDLDLDALRRRVYASDATDVDVQQYRDALAATRMPGEPVGHVEGGTPLPVRRRSRPARLWRLVAAVGGAAALCAVAVGLAHQPSAPGPSPSPVAVPPDVRSRFIADVRRGDTTSIANALIAHPERLPSVLRAAHRAEVGQLAAAGAGVVDLRPSAIADSGGRLTVVVVTDDDAPVRWEATREPRPWSGPGRTIPVASSQGDVTAGVPAAATTAYRSGAPTRVRVEAPAGVHWAAFAVLTD